MYLSRRATGLTILVFSIPAIPAFPAASLVLMSSSPPRNPGPYTPTLILHGGAGSITRRNLPPTRYHAYHDSLSQYLRSTSTLLASGASALDAAVYAVSLMEDDALFNCGRGSVLNEAGDVEMEASVMVAGVGDDVPLKRFGAVSLVQETRHPVLLARAVLLEGEAKGGLGGVRTMHGHLSGRSVEEWGWREKGLERKERRWFTEPREGGKSCERDEIEVFVDGKEWVEKPQGTVGAVCMDSWGNLAVSTSTGGLWGKKAGRIGDTPTVGAGFWADGWEDVDRRCDKAHKRGERLLEDGFGRSQASFIGRLRRALDASFGDLIADCLPGVGYELHTQEQDIDVKNYLLDQKHSQPRPMMATMHTFIPPSQRRYPHRRRCVAMSGTGNGDSFLRTDAVRTAAAMCRFESPYVSLAEAVTRIAGRGGELQLSAGDRWGNTGEGEGGIIGIELLSDEKKGRVVFDFNCGGMWRAWIDEETGRERVMVFNEEYEVWA